MNKVLAKKNHKPQIRGAKPEVKIEREHCSVGAIPVREGKEGTWEVLVHYFEKTPPYPLLSEEPVVLERVYKLMTETPEKGEKHQATLKRGLVEEFGVCGNLLSSAHCRISVVRPWYHPREKAVHVTRKTTDFYIVCGVKDCGGRQTEEPEGKSELRWVEINELIKMMEEQGKRYPELPDGNESAPLVWALANLEEEQRFQREAETLGTKRKRKN